MATQISHLRSGVKKQFLNPEVDYSKIGHIGSNQNDVELIWKQVTHEHPENMRVRVMDIEVDLKANWSLSCKSVSYCGTISKEDLEDKFFLKAAKNESPSISIQSGNIIIISNGKNSFTHVCPSLIKIL